MTKDEALKLTKNWFEQNTYGDEAVEVYEAIEQALAQPEQEPVGWFWQHEKIWHQHIGPNKDGCTLLYTKSPQRKEQPAQPEQDTEAHYKGVIDDVQKLFDDKREAQSEQEPVAWMKASDTEWSISFFKEDGYVPLYTTPPQRTWVGLMRGVRVEGDTVVISVKGGNDEARCLCSELINEMEMRHGKD
jgi:hypothetical protein